MLRKLHSPLIERYVTVSKHLEQFLIDRIGVAAPRITQIYNGVDTERFTPGARGTELVWIGTVGRIQPVKDQATLLRAFALALTSRPELRQRLRLAIIGEGPLLRDLKQLADSLGVAPLTSLPGANHDIPGVLRGFDVFVLPSLNEGISNTLLEAMAAGLPVIASEVGGNPELVQANVSGRFFKAGDIEGLSRLLTEYALDAALRRAHGEAARRIAVERFSLHAMVNNYETLYDRVSSSARQ